MPDGMSLPTKNWRFFVMVKVIGSGRKFSKGINPQLFEEPEELEEMSVIDVKKDEALLARTGVPSDTQEGTSEGKGKINKDNTIAELIDKDPSLAKDLSAQGLGCVGCPMSQFETLEQGALTHGMDPDELIKNLNSGEEEYEEYD